MSLEVFLAVKILDVFLLVGTNVLEKPANEGRRFLYSFISVDPYRITHPLDMENGYNNTKCTISLKQV